MQNSLISTYHGPNISLFQVARMSSPQLLFLLPGSRMIIDEDMHFTHATHLNSNGLQE
jgi:hypothetical protein